MDLNEYTLAMLVATKLEDARAAAARRALVSRRRPSARARLGTVLIVAGRRLVARDIAARTRVEPRHA
jgi:hypothetical protein